MAEGVKRILHVDDDKDMLETVKMILQSMSNVEVDSTDNGKEALEMFNRNRYDLVILDLMMPDMSGFEIFEKIKNRNAKIIFLTVTKISQKEIEEYKRKGLNEYILKPFENAYLIKETQKLLHFHMYEKPEEET